MSQRQRHSPHRHYMALVALMSGAVAIAAFLVPTASAVPAAAAAPAPTTSASTTTTVPGVNCNAAVSGDALARNGWSASTNAPSSSGDAPWHALDGNISTRFSTDESQRAGLYLQVDLQYTETFNQLGLYVPGSPTDYGRGFLVQTSDNASSWSTVASCNGTGARQVVSFPTQTARYLRIVLTASTNYWWSIDELDLYAPVGCSAAVGGLALPRSGWKAVTNANPSSSDVPAKAFDNNLATRFSTDQPQKSGLYFQLDLGSVQNFDELSMLSPGSPNDYARSFDVQLSDNATSWWTVASCNGTSDLETVSFPPQDARYMRITLTSATTYWWSIDELYLYTNEPLPTTTTTTTTVPRSVTNLYSSADPVTVGNPVTYTAKISPAPSGGYVNFMSDGAALPGCTNVALAAGGEASCTTTYYASGRYTVQAFYSGAVSVSGSPGSQPSASPSYAEVVNLPPAGYLLATSNGEVFAGGAAQAMGGMATNAATGPVVGIASTPSAKGYWMVTSDGTVSTFGDARFYGDLPALGKKVHDIVAIAPTSDGRGYYLVGADGGFFTFGDATFHGSLPGLHIRAHDIVGMVGSPGGSGYLLVGRDGGVFTFGSTRFYGSLPGIHRHVRDIRAILPASAGTGYVLVGADGGAFIFGTGVQFHGSLPGQNVRVRNIVGIALTPDDGGYWMAGSDGRVYGFGDAQAAPMPAGLSNNLPVVAIAGT